MSETEFIDNPIRYLSKVMLSDLALNTTFLFISMVGYGVNYYKIEITRKDTDVKPDTWNLWIASKVPRPPSGGGSSSSGGGRQHQQGRKGGGAAAPATRGVEEDELVEDSGSSASAEGDPFRSGDALENPLNPLRNYIVNDKTRLSIDPIVGKPDCMSYLATNPNRRFVPIISKEDATQLEADLTGDKAFALYNNADAPSSITMKREMRILRDGGKGGVGDDRDTKITATTFDETKRNYCPCNTTFKIGGSDTGMPGAYVRYKCVEWAQSIANILWNGSPILFYIIGVCFFFAMIPGFTSIMTIFYKNKNTLGKSRKLQASISILWVVFVLYLIRFVMCIVLLFMMISAPVDDISKQYSKNMYPVMIRASFLWYQLVNFITLLMASVFQSQVMLG